MSREKIDEEELKKLEEKHESDLTPKEKRLLEKYKLSRMGWLGKLEYIWAYYKPAIFGVVILIGLVFLGRDMYHNSKLVTELSISVVSGGGIDTESMEAKIKDLLGYTGEYEQVDIYTNLNVDQSGSQLEYQSQMVFMTYLASSQLDVILLPESLYESMQEQDIFADLRTEVFGESVYDSLGAEGDERHLILDAADLKEYYDSYYDPVCAVVAANSTRKEAAGKWLTTLLE